MEILPYLSQYANLILIAITAIYATLTWMMLKEMREARKAELRPCIKASLDLIGSDIVVLKIQNIGKGAAIDINAEFSLEPSENAKATWQYRLLSSTESKRFLLPDPDKKYTLDALTEKYKEVIVKISYKDVFNEMHEETLSINLKEFKEGLFGSIMLLDTSMKEHIEDIKKHIKEISKNLKEISNQIKKYLEKL
jgi:hypothetical protein